MAASIQQTPLLPVMTQQHRFSVHTTPQPELSIASLRQPSPVHSPHENVFSILECTKRVYCSRCHPSQEPGIEAPTSPTYAAAAPARSPNSSAGLDNLFSRMKPQPNKPGEPYPSKCLALLTRANAIPLLSPITEEADYFLASQQARGTWSPSVQNRLHLHRLHRREPSSPTSNLTPQTRWRSSLLAPTARKRLTHLSGGLLAANRPTQLL